MTSHLADTEDRAADLTPGLIGPVATPNEPAHDRGAVISVGLHRSAQEIAELLPKWRELFDRVETEGPFAQPDDLLAWATHYLPAGAELHVVAVRQGRELIAVAPFFRRFVGSAQRFSTIHPLGNLYDPVVSELPEIVCVPGRHHQAIRAVVTHLAAQPRVLWSEIPITANQGWLTLPTVGSMPGGRGVVFLHKLVRPSVVVRIDPDDWAAELPKVKRNLRESLRRCRNRLRGLGVSYEVTCDLSDTAGFQGALADLRRLHGERTRLAGPAHEDVFARATTAPFLSALGGRSSSTVLRVHRLRVDGRCVAALLTFTSGRRLWISISGMDEVGAELSGVTWLQATAIREASKNGVMEAAFSIGVDVAKLRWSEEVRSHHEFFLVRRSPLALLVFGLYSAARGIRSMRDVRGRSES